MNRDKVLPQYMRRELTVRKLRHLHLRNVVGKEPCAQVWNGPALGKLRRHAVAQHTGNTLATGLARKKEAKHRYSQILS